MIDKPLTQSGVGERIWQLAGEDIDEFNREVTRYFARAYPNFRVAEIDYKRKIIWLRDER